MKAIKFILIAILFSVGTTSCLLDQDAGTDYSVSPNVVGFADSSMKQSYFVDAGDQSLPVPVRIDGPMKYDITSAVTATVTVNAAATTAIEGTHYTIGDATVTFTPETNYLDVFDLTIKTDGIDPTTITENPVIVLNIGGASDASILNNGRAETITIELLYICPSDLAGDYSNPGAPNCAQSDPITVEVVGDGRYKVSSVTNWSWTSGNCIYFYMIDNCNTLTYDGGEFDEAGYPTSGSGTVNADGSFEFTFSTPSLGWTETSTYTPL